MVEIRVNFPLEEDAHKLNYSINSFFTGSEVFVNDNIIVGPVKKDTTNPDKPVWYFLIDICKENDNMEIEKFTSVSGGLLSIMNGDRQVWAFA